MSRGWVWEYLNWQIQIWELGRGVGSWSSIGYHLFGFAHCLESIEGDVRKEQKGLQ